MGGQASGLERKCSGGADESERACLPHCPPRFVWSVRNKAMLNTVLDYNVSQHEPWAVPRNLPWSFRWGRLRFENKESTFQLVWDEGLACQRNLHD